MVLDDVRQRPDYPCRVPLRDHILILTFVHRLNQDDGSKLS